LSITTTDNPRRIEDLAESLENIRAARPIAMEVLRLADDPNADAAKIAASIDQDPILMAQVLRLANSAAFGMERRVASTQIAVAILGFSTIRSIAILVASGLRNLKHSPPESFWEHSAATAAACSILSRRFSVSPGDGFALGLIHDIGIPMLNCADPVTYAALSAERFDDSDSCLAEANEFGMDHAEAAGLVLGMWSFPEATVDAVARHHIAERPVSNEGKLLAAADALSHLAVDKKSEVDYARLEMLGFADDEIKRYRKDVGGKTGGILAGLLRS